MHSHICNPVTKSICMDIIAENTNNMTRAWERISRENRLNILPAYYTKDGCTWKLKIGFSKLHMLNYSNIIKYRITKFRCHPTPSMDASMKALKLKDSITKFRGLTTIVMYSSPTPPIREGTTASKWCQRCCFALSSSHYMIARRPNVTTKRNTYNQHLPALNII